MKVLLSVVVWGSDYVATLADFSLASQTSPGNIPRLAQRHEVAYHIVTTQKDAQILRAHPVFAALTKFCSVLWDYIEDSGYNPTLIPRGDGGEKYTFLSRMQNIGIRRSLAFDVLVFNYADFIWADGSLTNVVDLMHDGADAVLSFGLPVDSSRAKAALGTFRTQAAGIPALAVPPREAAGIAIDHLHREAKLRFWDGPSFTRTPTYLIWPVGDQGLIVRAYHQTVLTLRVRRDDEDYAQGIRYGSLDGYFTAQLAATANIRYAADSDDILVFSLYDAKIDTALRPGETREDALRLCLERAVSVAQRRCAEIPLLVKRRTPDAALWRRAIDASWKAIEPIERTAVPDAKEFESVNAQIENTELIEAHWRSRANPARWLYVRVLLPFANGPLGSAIKGSLGKGRARAIRLVLERLLFRRAGAGS